MPKTPLVQVTMFSKDDCPACASAAAFFEAHVIDRTEIKLNDRADRLALYDRFGLQGTDRTVPQIVLTDPWGDTYRIGGAHELTMSGLQSLFVNVPSSLGTSATAVRVASEIAAAEAENAGGEVCESCQ